MSIAARQKMERQIARKVVTSGIAAGYQLSVFDGGEVTVARSTTVSEVMAGLFTTDDDRLLFFRPGEAQPCGWVWLVYGNDGWDVVNDYTTNLESVMKPADKLADRLGAGA